MIDTFDVLLQYLKPLGISEVLRSRDSVPLTAVEKYRPGEHMQPGVLYVGRCSELVGCFPDASLALIGDGPCQASGCRAILMEPQVDVACLFAAARQIIYRCNCYCFSANRIMTAGVRNGNLPQIVSVGAEELHAQLVVADRLLYPVAWKTNEQMHEPSWESLVEEGLVPPLSWMSEIDNKKPLAVFSQCRIYEWENNIRDKESLLIDLGTNTKEQGYLSVIMEEDAGDFYWLKELVAVLAAVLSSELGSKTGQTATNSVFEHYMVALIENRFDSDWDAKQLTQDTGLKAEGVYSLVIVDMTKYSFRQRSLQSFRTSLEKTLRVTRSTIYKDQIILLLTALSVEKAINRNYSELESLLAEAGVYAAVSRPFTCLWELPSNYNGTSKILSRSFCAPTGTMVLSAENMGISFAIDALLRIEKPGDLVDPRVKTLLHYDKMNGTSYVDTLLTYLKNSKKPSITCSNLHIHRNTLDYRLQKIVDLVGIDWNDGDLCFRLYLSLNVIRFCNLRDRQFALDDILG